MFCCCGGHSSATSPAPGDGDNLKDDPDTVLEMVLCPVGQIPDGGKEEFDVAGTPVLVIRDKGRYYGTGALCPHLKTRLVNGIYRNGSIRCPAHGARFSVQAGDIEDYPSFGCLPTYKVFERGDNVIVEKRGKGLQESWTYDWQSVPSSSTISQNNIIVIGTGPAALSFVETLRKLGCTTRIEMITQEFELPYDRTMLNKKIFKNVMETRIHDEAWYKRMNIDVKTNTRMLYINKKSRTLVLSNSCCLYYAKLFIAIGCIPKRLQVPGEKLANVCYVRTMQDCMSLWERAKGGNVVCIGGSFIGMEAASILLAICESVTVVCTTEEPLPAFGRDVGAALRKYFDRKGIRVIVKATVDYLSGSEMGAVEAVHLGDGEVLPATCVVVGIGVRPDTDILHTSQLPTSDRGYLLVDENMTVEENIWAGGDVVECPLQLWDVPDAHIEHFQVAQKHGQIAAHSLMGQRTFTAFVPFFWGRFFDELSLKSSGYQEDYDSTIVHGDLANFDFTKYYLKDDTVISVVSAGPSNAAVQFLDLFQKRIKVSGLQVERNLGDDWTLWKPETAR
ncbi:unnamed protein product, partial [Mesorhabditis spiculigera]